MSYEIGMLMSVVIVMMLIRLYSRYYYIETLRSFITLTNDLKEDGYALVVSDFKGGFLRAHFTVRLTVTEIANVRNTWVYTCYGAYHYKPPFYPIELNLFKVSEQTKGEMGRVYAIHKLPLCVSLLRDIIYGEIADKKNSNKSSLDRVLALARHQNMGSRLPPTPRSLDTMRLEDPDLDYSEHTAILINSIADSHFIDCVAKASNEIKTENESKVHYMKSRKPKPESIEECSLDADTRTVSEDTKPVPESITTKYPSLFDDMSATDSSDNTSGSSSSD
jgi:hypothetical protein